MAHASNNGRAQQRNRHNADAMSCGLPPGIDGRTVSGRRFRALMHDLASDMGGAETLSATERALLRQAASVTILSERMQVAIVNGDPVDPDKLIQLTETSRRCLESIRRQALPRELCA